MASYSMVVKSENSRVYLSFNSISTLTNTLTLEHLFKYSFIFLFFKINEIIILIF